MIRKTARHPARRTARRGVAAAELAIILPLLLLLVFICIDFGRYASTYVAVHNAARAGAAYAIMNSYTTGNQTTWENNVESIARAEFTGQPGCDPARLTIQRPVVQSVDPSTGDRYIVVQATYNAFETVVNWPGIPQSQVLTARVRMRSIR